MSETVTQVAVFRHVIKLPHVATFRHVIKLPHVATFRNVTCITAKSISAGRVELHLLVA